MSGNDFNYSPERLRELARDVLQYAAKSNATACEVDVSEGFGQSVSVRKQAVDTIEYNRDKGVGISVYVGQRRGHASTSDFSPQAVRATVDAAISIARFKVSRPQRDAPPISACDFTPRTITSIELASSWTNFFCRLVIFLERM